MKIRIIGSCGSGKSTMARELSQMYAIPYFEIDNIIWDRSEKRISILKKSEMRHAPEFVLGITRRHFGTYVK